MTIKVLFSKLNLLVPEKSYERKGNFYWEMSKHANCSHLCFKMSAAKLINN